MYHTAKQLRPVPVPSGTRTHDPSRDLPKKPFSVPEVLPQILPEFPEFFPEGIPL